MPWPRRRRRQLGRPRQNAVRICGGRRERRKTPPVLTPFSGAAVEKISLTMAKLREEVKHIEQTNWMYAGGGTFGSIRKI